MSIENFVVVMLVILGLLILKFELNFSRFLVEFVEEKLKRNLVNMKVSSILGKI